MPYVYEGEEPTRVNGVRYAPGTTSDDDAVKGKSGFRKVSDNEVQELAANRPGNFPDAQTDAWQERFSDAVAWMGAATVAAPLNVVVGDNEAPYGPPTGTITTKQAVMRDADNSVERKAFGDHEWVAEDAEERNLDESTSGKVQAAQARQSGTLEEITEEYIQAKEESTEGASDDSDASAARSSQSSSQGSPS